jgi:hypothetical protein
MPPRPVDLDPNMPLRNERHETFARLRAILTPKLQAAREAGFETMTPGNAAKLDRRKDIRARIAAMSAVDEEIVRMKRERIEARLMKAMEADILRDFAIVEKVVVNGVETSKVVGIDWEKLRASDSSVIVSEFAFDAETGHLTKFKRDDAMNAAAQLRDMLGFKAPSKVAMTDPSGNQAAGLPEGDAQGDITQVLSRLLGIADRKLVMELRGLLDASGDKAGGE